MKNKTSAVKTAIVILAVFAAFWVGVGQAQQIVRTYVCPADGSVTQTAGLYTPRCPKCGGIMFEQR